MKVLLYILTALVIVIVGCRKEELNTIKDEKLYNVSFGLTESNVKNGATTFSGDTIKSFKYYVYNSNGDYVDTRKQEEIVLTPTTIKLKIKLPAGTYKIAFIGGDATPNVFVPDRLESSDFEINTRYSIFHKLMDVTVTGDLSVNSVQLQRINSALEFDFLDETIPDNIKTIQVNYSDYKYMNLSGSLNVVKNLFYSINFVQTPTGRKPVSNVPFIFDIDHEKSIGLTYYDQNNNVVKTKIVKATFAKNRKTLISGYFFAP